MCVVGGFPLGGAFMMMILDGPLGAADFLSSDAIMLFLELNLNKLLLFQANKRKECIIAI